MIKVLYKSAAKPNGLFLNKSDMSWTDLGFEPTKYTKMQNDLYIILGKENVAFLKLDGSFPPESLKPAFLSFETKEDLTPALEEVE